MRPRLIVAMPRGAAQVSLTVPAMYGLLALYLARTPPALILGPTPATINACWSCS